MIYHINYPNDEGVKYERFTYPGGETQVRLLQTDANPAQTLCARAEELWLTARIRDGEVMTVALLVDAMRGLRPVPVKLILPYLPYARADREFCVGDCCGLGVFSDMVNAMTLHEVITVDVHNEAAAKKFINGFRNVSPLPLIENVIAKLPRALTLILPDEGAALRYGLQKLGLPLRYCTKKRDPKTGKFLGFTIPPKDEFTTTHALMIDDICDGGGTFIGIAKQMADYPLFLNLYTTHSLYSKGTEELFKHFGHIFTSNTFQPAYEDKALEVIPYEALDIFGGKAQA